MSAPDAGEPRPSNPPSAPPPPAAGAAPPHVGPGQPAAGGGRGFTIAGGVLGIVAILFAPIILGPIGIALGYVGYRKGDPKAKIAMIVAGAGTVIGIILGVLVLQQLGGFPS